MKVITTDLDGVQCQFNPSFHAWVNEKTGTNLNYEGQTSFKYEECWGQTKEYWSALMKQFCEEGNLLHLPVYQEGVDAIKKLAPAYRIIAVTYRHPSNIAITQEYVTRELPEISDVVFRADKAEFCHEVNAIAHFEDHLDCVKSFTNGTRAYLIDRPWNRQEKYPHRHSNWELILQDLIK